MQPTAARFMAAGSCSHVGKILTRNKKWPLYCLLIIFLFVNKLYGKVAEWKSVHLACQSFVMLCSGFNFKLNQSNFIYLLLGPHDSLADVSRSRSVMMIHQHMNN